MPPVVYPPIPAKPEKPEEKEEKKQEDKKSETKEETSKEADTGAKAEIRDLTGSETKSGKIKAVININTLTEGKVQVKAGDKSYTVSLEAKELKVGDKVKVFAKKGNKYVIVSKKTNTVRENGLTLSLTPGNDYAISDIENAKKIEDKIFKAVSLKKKTVSVKVGDKVKIELSDKVDKANIKSVSYIFDSPNISINKKGVLKGKISGTVNITVKIRLKNNRVKTLKLKINVK